MQVGAEVELLRLQSLHSMKRAHGVGAHVDSAQAVVGAHPDVTVGIFFYPVDRVVGQAVRLGQGAEPNVGQGASRCGVVDAAIACADPDSPCAVDMNGVDGISAQCSRVGTMP